MSDQPAAPAVPELGRLKHQPVFLLPYAAHDGPYSGNTDCQFLSLGWAQYDPRRASLKTLRHTGTKWSRQSEELPLHRAIDLVSLLAHAIRSMSGQHVDTIHLPAGTLDHQQNDILIQAFADVTDGDNFRREMTDEIVLRRLARLRDVLNELHDEGLL